MIWGEAGIEDQKVEHVVWSAPRRWKDPWYPTRHRIIEDVNEVHGSGAALAKDGTGEEAGHHGAPPFDSTLHADKGHPVADTKQKARVDALTVVEAGVTGGDYGLSTMVANAAVDGEDAGYQQVV